MTRLLRALAARALVPALLFCLAGEMLPAAVCVLVAVGLLVGPAGPAAGAPPGTGSEPGRPDR
ncbi:hypothetical protein ACFVIM_08245 [Streptomyces sp. NPDC057638]|uniref:hypothetical protein n=1 Tax=Streptomyces sp. NPDC057638 TaxID=3346190 RepID=UPI0036ABE777